MLIPLSPLSPHTSLSLSLFSQRQHNQDPRMAVKRRSHGRNKKGRGHVRIFGERAGGGAPQRSGRPAETGRPRAVAAAAAGAAPRQETLSHARASACPACPDDMWSPALPLACGGRRARPAAPARGNTAAVVRSSHFFFALPLSLPFHRSSASAASPPASWSPRTRPSSASSSATLWTRPPSGTSRTRRSLRVRKRGADRRARLGTARGGWAEGGGPLL